MARKNTFLYVIVGLLAIVAIYFIWQSTPSKKPTETYERSKIEPEIEMVPQADVDDFQLVEDSTDESFEPVM